MERDGRLVKYWIVRGTGPLTVVEMTDLEMSESGLTWVGRFPYYTREAAEAAIRDNPDTLC